MSSDHLFIMSQSPSGYFCELTQPPQDSTTQNAYRDSSSIGEGYPDNDTIGDWFSGIWIETPRALSRTVSLEYTSAMPPMCESQLKQLSLCFFHEETVLVCCFGITFLSVTSDKLAT